MLRGVGERVAAWEWVGQRLRVSAHSVVGRASCPECGRASRKPHGRCWRQLSECPCLSHPESIEIEVLRFRCGNAACVRSAPSPSRLPSSRGRASAVPRLAAARCEIELAMGGGQAGARLSARLGLRTSGDALLRGLRRAGTDIGSAPLAVIGVDEQRAGRGADQSAQVPQAPDVRSREARFTADPRAESPSSACTQNKPLGKPPALGGFAPPMLVRD